MGFREEQLFDFLYGASDAESKYEHWCETVAGLLRKQARVLTHPIVTVFGFIAQPEMHIYLKTNVTRAAAREYGYNFQYNSRPSWDTYASFLEFADIVHRDTRDMRSRDMIDIQSFIWMQGSDEYDE
ncbi:MAG: hypothetical protein H0T92_02150 [Pyrinomonadaceae bacterium]|nr:hypothetical protein [Pyrinomonadaceae bacterium]